MDFPLQPMAGPSRPPPDVARTPCRFFTAGYCWRGSNCWFSHAPMSFSTSGDSSSRRLPPRPFDGQGIRNQLRDSASNPSAQASGSQSQAQTNRSAGNGRSNPRTQAMERDRLAGRATQGGGSQLESEPEAKPEVTETQEEGKGKGKRRGRGKGNLRAKDRREQKAKDAENQPPAVEIKTKAVDSDGEELSCGICFEVPKTYGLLEKCSHVFCAPCIKLWRSPVHKTEDQLAAGTLHQCPACRVNSSFVLPRRRYLSNGPQKDDLIVREKTRWGRLNCKHYGRFKNCPYGKECYYRHVSATGEIVTFNHTHSQWLLRRSFDSALGNMVDDMHDESLNGIFGPGLFHRMIGDWTSIDRPASPWEPIIRRTGPTDTPAPRMFGPDTNADRTRSAVPPPAPEAAQGTNQARRRGGPTDYDSREFLNWLEVGIQDLEEERVRRAIELSLRDMGANDSRPSPLFRSYGRREGGDSGTRQSTEARAADAEENEWVNMSGSEVDAENGDMPPLEDVTDSDGPSGTGAGGGERGPGYLQYDSADELQIAAANYVNGRRAPGWTAFRTAGLTPPTAQEPAGNEYDDMPELEAASDT